MPALSRRVPQFLSLVLFFSFFDQLTKLLARSLLQNQTVIRLFGDTIRLQVVRNSGGLASLGATTDGFQSVAVLWTICMLGAVFAYGLASRPEGPRTLVASALVFSGGLGNLLDRLLEGGVLDFINLNIVGLRTAVFNLADILIVAGFLTLLISVLADRKAWSQRRSAA